MIRQWRWETLTFVPIVGPTSTIGQLRRSVLWLMNSDTAMVAKRRMARMAIARTLWENLSDADIDRRNTQ